ncbi:tetratricopeptide repeat protein [Hyphomonas pacifica]|uniref:Uncharacterized protein n=1 Tax=Hyphomonas pacifica TaxID=1280941 RepID=A0A062U8N4_9PROT|nr:tetratricopeptide repeat protein [Hyphomonas pacifica]KCZ52994.1 hypothetical protein HY2_00285 [Hyphomonas pacifica]RAN36147.1 hypothetical protein HY3_00785 [Hyphomonas pacifica]
MRIAATALSILVLAVAALPATAQYGDVKRTQAEIALEEARSSLEGNRAARSDALTACASRDYDACFRLGDMYRRGMGGLQDYEKAAEAYRKSCNGKNGEGCAGLAYLTTHGRGVDADPVKARVLYEKSCDYGELSGCAAYGNMLYTGQGGSKNVAKGQRLLQDACDRDYEWACDRLTGLGAYQPDDDTWQRLKDAKSRY